MLKNIDNPDSFVKNKLAILISANMDVINQHHLETRPVHRNMAPSQTSEVGRAPKNCNSYLDAIFKRHH